MGIKRTLNNPVFYEELKKPHGISLTPTAWGKIKALATSQGISASEVIERWARKLLPLEGED
jgi:hypothetical protein